MSLIENRARSGPVARINPVAKLGAAVAITVPLVLTLDVVLAAVALALVLLNIFTNNDFFTAMLKFVVGLIAKVGGMIP